MSEDLSFPEDIQKATHIKRCSPPPTSTAARTATVSEHLPPANRSAVTKRRRWEEEEREPSCTTAGTVTSGATMENSTEVPQKIKDRVAKYVEPSVTQVLLPTIHNSLRHGQ